MLLFLAIIYLGIITVNNAILFVLLLKGKLYSSYLIDKLLYVNLCLNIVVLMYLVYLTYFQLKNISNNITTSECIRKTKINLPDYTTINGVPLSALAIWKEIIYKKFTYYANAQYNNELKLLLERNKLLNKSYSKVDTKDTCNNFLVNDTDIALLDKC